MKGLKEGLVSIVAFMPSMSTKDQLGGAKAFPKVIFPLPILTSGRDLLGNGPNPEIGAPELVLATTFDLIPHALGGCKTTQ